MATAFSDEKERARLFAVMGSLTNERIIADAGAYADFLLARPEVRGPAIGTTGHCMGGRMSMLAAGAVAARIGAATSFHGGRIAVADDLGSPHLAADRITATVYVAGAVEDSSTPRSPPPGSSTPSSSTRPATASRCQTTTPTTRRQATGTGRRCGGCTRPGFSQGPPDP